MARSVASGPGDGSGPSRNAGVRELAAEFALDEESHIAWVKDALAHLPEPFQPNEAQPGDPTIEQRM